MGSSGDASGRGALVALDLSGPLGLQSRQAAAGLRLWAEAADTDLKIVDLEGSRDALEHLYWSWCQTQADIILLPYGSGLVRTALQGVPEDRLVFNHGGTDDELARPWAPMVPAPASTYFTPLVELADQRGCASLTILRGPGSFAATVSLGGLARAQELGFPAALVALADWEPAHLIPTVRCSWWAASRTTSR